jgi:hypothetical protein
MHKTILPRASGHTPPPSRCPQQQQLQQQSLMHGTTWQHVTPLAQFGGMHMAGGNYRQCNTMAVPVYQSSQAMMNFVGQTLQVLGPYQ